VNDSYLERRLDYLVFKSVTWICANWKS